MELGEPKTKKFKHSIISEHLFTSELQEIFYKHWHEHSSIKTPEIEVIAEPFRICRISNFLKSEEFMDEIKNELLDVKSRRNSIDLYQFEQSNNLSQVERTNVKRLYKTFQTDMVNWMEKNTEIELNKKISMASSCYSDTDYLLCHDDNIRDRRIAFILYLSKNWLEEDGGALDLFDTDEHGLPRNVVKSLIPEYNSLVFFEVVDNSYHQVAEVVSPEKSRWSINGWFHGPIVEKEGPERPRLPVTYYAPEINDVDLSSWISNIYLHQGIIKEIQEDTEEESFAFLANFINEDIFKKLSEELESECIKWNKVGPADIRNYEVAEINSLPEILADFLKIFKSYNMFQLLKNYTELDLIPDSNKEPKMTMELQRWSKGCYTLISDKYGQDESLSDSTEKKSSPDTSKLEPEVSEQSSASVKLSNASNRYTEEFKSKNKNISEEAGCNTPPSSAGDDSEDNTSKRPIAEKSPKSKRCMADSSSSSQQQQESTPPKTDSPTTREKRRDSDIDRSDSEVSDIGDYLSDPLDCSFDDDCEACDDDEVEEEDERVPGSLDVILQFHTDRVPEDTTIDYLDPNEKEAALAHVPPKDNHLCFVYKTVGVCRVHKYINHYCKGYFYNLVCTYWE